MRKTEFIHLRCSSEVKTELKEEAEQVCLSLTEYLLRCGLKTGLPKQFERPIETRQLGRQLLSIAGRLNRVLNNEGSTELRAIAQPLIDDLLKGAEGLTK